MCAPQHNINFEQFIEGGRLLVEVEVGLCFFYICLLYLTLKIGQPTDWSQNGTWWFQFKELKTKVSGWHWLTL